MYVLSLTRTCILITHTLIGFAKISLSRMFICIKAISFDFVPVRWALCAPAQLQCSQIGLFPCLLYRIRFNFRGLKLLHTEFGARGGERPSPSPPPPSPLNATLLVYLWSVLHHSFFCLCTFRRKWECLVRTVFLLITSPMDSLSSRLAAPLQNYQSKP